MDGTMALWYAVALVILLIALQVLTVPLQVMAKVAASSVAGGAVLWGLNLVGSFLGFHMALNPASAVIAGMLGLPGIVGLAVMRAILG